MPKVRRDGRYLPNVRRDGLPRPKVRRDGLPRPKVRRDGWYTPRVRRSSPLRLLMAAVGAAPAAGRTGMIAAGAGVSLLVFAVVNILFSCLAGPGRKVVPPPVTGCLAGARRRQRPDCPFDRGRGCGHNCLQTY